MGSLKRKWRLLKQASFAREKKNILGPFAKAILYSTQNGSFLAPVEDIEIGNRIGKEGSYDLEELREIEKLVDSHSVVFVVGTHIGLLLVPLAKKVKRIIGYEANPRTHELIELNISLNNLTNATVYNYAAGEKRGEVEFYLNVVNSGGSKIKPMQDNYMYRFDNPETIKVKMEAIDEHIVSQQLPAPNVIIMDIEGAEYFALKGMQKTLSTSTALYIEYIPHHLKNVAGVKATDFFELILPHYAKAKFMKHPEKIYDLRNEVSSFSATIETMQKNEKDDNILFYKS